MTDVFETAMRDILDSVVGVDAIYTPAGGVAANIRVLFDKIYSPELGMQTELITAEALTSDIPAATKDETLTIDGVVYKIKQKPYLTDYGTSEIELSID
jgi:hypothetical protein